MASSYVFMFFPDGAQPTIFPIAPESCEVTIENKNEPLTLVDYGEVNILRKPGLKTFNFEVFLPAMPIPMARYPEGFKPPEFYIDLIHQFKEEKTALNFLILRNAPGMTEAWKTTTLKVSVETCDVYEGWREYGMGAVLRLSLKKWAPYEVKTFVKDGDGTFREKKTTPEKIDSVVRRDTAKENTTAANVAKQEYGDFDQFKRFNKDNPDTEKDPFIGFMKGTEYKVGGNAE
ncbi:MAG: hypothetical protein IJT09_06580 [Abditibacteriota bacterium]|nr:hypothetical protein [Abditibacteriota bacterium]